MSGQFLTVLQSYSMQHANARSTSTCASCVILGAYIRIQHRAQHLLRTYQLQGGLLVPNLVSLSCALLRGHRHVSAEPHTHGRVPYPLGMLLWHVALSRSSAMRCDAPSAASRKVLATLLFEGVTQPRTTFFMSFSIGWRSWSSPSSRCSASWPQVN